LAAVARRLTGLVLGLGCDSNQGIAGHMSKLSDGRGARQARLVNLPVNKRFFRSPTRSALAPLTTWQLWCDGTISDNCPLD
jgi:hypothetical protein